MYSHLLIVDLGKVKPRYQKVYPELYEMLTTCLIGNYLCLVAFHLLCVHILQRRENLYLTSVCELFVAHEHLRAALSPSAAVPILDGLYNIRSLHRLFLHCKTS